VAVSLFFSASTMSYNIQKNRLLNKYIFTNTDNNDITDINIRLIRNNKDINRASIFLTTNVYGGQKSKSQERVLTQLINDDLNDRYKVVVDGAPQKYPSAFLLAEEDEDIIGCVGLDTQILNEKKRTLIKRPNKFNIDSLVKDDKLVMVLSNLVVRRDKQNLGHAKQLIKSCEIIARDFLFKEVFLMVDSENIHAQRLYKKIGYKKIFQDNNASCVVSTPLALIKRKCVNYCYRKIITSSNKKINTRLLLLIVPIFVFAFVQHAC
jgi:ribosomal protein S18 acetylase RimI-like enzyme